MTKAELTASTATQGPAITAIIVAPTPCAVVPPTTGTFSIMIRKLVAALAASTGTDFGCERISFVLRLATYQTGMVITHPAAMVSGPR